MDFVTFNGIVENLIANLITVLITFLITLLIIVIIYLVQYRKQLKFFGLTKKNPNVIIYLSVIRPKGVHNNYAVNSKEYDGKLVGLTEMQGAKLIYDKLVNRFFSYLPEKFSDYLGSISLKFVSVKPIIDFSPDNEENISKNDNLILIGGSNFNYASAIFFNKFLLPYKFEYDDQGNPFVIPFGKSKDKFPARNSTEESAFIYRFKYNQRTITICDGASQGTTYASINYLIKNIRLLNKEQKSEDFAIHLRFKKEDDLNAINKNEPSKDSGKPTHVDLIESASNSDRYSNDFFKMNNIQIMEHYRCILPVIKEKIKDQELKVIVDELEPLVIKIDLNTNESKYFKFFEGTVYSYTNCDLTLPFEIFRYLLFIDFSIWRDHELYQNSILNKTQSLSLELQVKIINISNLWYLFSKKATYCFFEDTNLSQYFKKFSHTWWDEDKTAAVKFKKLSEKINFGDINEKIILDAGCGYGRVFKDLFEKNISDLSRYVLLDISDQMLRKFELSFAKFKDKYQTKCGNINDIHQMGFEENYFDIIMLIQVSMHLANPFRCLDQIKPFLKKDGNIWIDFTCTNDNHGTENYFQESFFTRIYKIGYIDDQIKQLGFNIKQKEQIRDRGNNYWYLLCLSKRQ